MAKKILFNFFLSCDFVDSLCFSIANQLEKEPNRNITAVGWQLEKA